MCVSLRDYSSNNLQIFPCRSFVLTIFVYMCDSYCLVHKQLSAKKQLKAAAWHAKQKTKQKDNKDHEKSLQPCKYFQNGFCKSVSCSLKATYSWLRDYLTKSARIYLNKHLCEISTCKNVLYVKWKILQLPFWLS